MAEQSLSNPMISRPFSRAASIVDKENGMSLGENSFSSCTSRPEQNCWVLDAPGKRKHKVRHYVIIYTMCSCPSRR